MLDHITGIHFLVDSDVQITIIPAKKRDPHKFTLQVVNESLIQTYGQKCFTLNLGLKWVFTHIFVITDVEKAILGADFFYTNMAFLWILTSVVWRTLWQTLSNLIWCIKDFPHPLPWLTQKRIQHFASFENFPVPDTMRKLRQFSGMINFYRRFLPKCVQVVKPLTDMLTDVKNWEIVLSDLA